MSKAPDPAPDFQLYAVIVAYDMWRMTAKHPGCRTLPEVLPGIMRCLRLGAKVYAENPRYALRKAIGEQILEALKDADPDAMVRKYRAKAERHWRALFDRCPARPLSNLDHNRLETAHGK